MMPASPSATALSASTFVTMLHVTSACSATARVTAAGSFHGTMIVLAVAPVLFGAFQEERQVLVTTPFTKYSHQVERTDHRLVGVVRDRQR